MRIGTRQARAVVALVVGLIAACGFVTAAPRLGPLHRIETTVGASSRQVVVDLGHFRHHAVASARAHMPANVAEWAALPSTLALTLGALAVCFLLVVRRSRVAPARARIRAPPVTIGDTRP